MKKLKLRIAKFDRMLVVEQLELEGEFKETDHVRVHGDLELFDGFIDLQEDIEDRRANYIRFDDNAERDEYTEKLIGWITEEQFGGTTKLEIGKPCLVSDNYEAEEWEERIYVGKVPVQLGLDKHHLVCSEDDEDTFFCWRYAKPINHCLKIDGEIYTWEQK